MQETAQKIVTSIVTTANAFLVFEQCSNLNKIVNVKAMCVPMHKRTRTPTDKSLALKVNQNIALDLEKRVAKVYRINILTVLFKIYHKVCSGNREGILQTDFRTRGRGGG